MQNRQPKNLRTPAGPPGHRARYTQDFAAPISGIAKNSLNAALAGHTRQAGGDSQSQRSHDRWRLPGNQAWGSPQLSIEIVSRVTWEPSRIDAYDRLLSPVSNPVVKALKNYRLDKNLFSLDID